MSKIETKQEKLQALADSDERWHRKLMRAANALDANRKARKRLLAPQRLERLEPPVPTDDIKHGGYHQIRHQEFSDDIPDFLRRV